MNENEREKRDEAWLALQKIKEEEQKMHQLMENIRQNRASKIIQKAYEQAQKIKDDYIKQAKKEAAKKKETIINRAEAEAERITKEAKEEINNMNKRLAPLMPEAIEKVRNKIRNYLKKGKF